MGVSWAILNNPVVRWALIAASVLIGLKLYGEKRERDGRISQREKQAIEESRALREKREQVNEIPKRADEARRRTGRPDHAGELSDDIAGVLFGHRGIEPDDG